jgi:imidazolonepropionase-like amidohydrolase
MQSQRRFQNIGALGLLVALIASRADDAQAETVRNGLVLDHVVVVDVRTGGLARDRAVIVADGKIVAVVRGGTVRVAGSGRLIEGRGRFVVPGFNDMHAHNLNTDSPATSLPLMLANGVTGFRQMAGSPELLAARANGNTLLPADSPALLAMPGNILAGAAFADPAAAVEEIARQKAQGADFIKVIDVPPAAFFAAEDAARDSGLPFAGHLSLAVDARDAMRRGMSSIEHLGPGIILLLNCSRDEAAIRAMIAAIPPGSGGSNFNADPEQLRRMLANPLLLTPPPGFALMRRVLASYDAAKCQIFAAEVAASSTWMVPTLTRLEAMELGDTPALKNNPDLRYAPAASLALWRQVGIDFDAKITPDQRQLLEQLFESQLRLTRLFDQAGVKMLTGTDFGGQWILPGFSLHHEFDLLARAGVAPLRVLQMTTLDPARFLKREATMGTVEPGRNADLVILDADPTRTVANLHRVSAVVRDGRYLTRADLDAIESRARAALP